MSYAVLYKANETDFNTLGLGVLRDAISPLVTEERNGQFELTMSYPVDGALFDEIKNDRIIKADASQKLKAQRFKIIRITKPAGGVVKVYAGTRFLLVAGFGAKTIRKLQRQRNAGADRVEKQHCR